MHVKKGVCMFRRLRNIAIATRTNRIRTVRKLSLCHYHANPDLREWKIKVALVSRYNNEDCTDANDAALIA